MNNRFLAVGIFIIGSLIVIILFNNLNDELKNIVNLFTLYGTFASLYGIIIAYIQIKNIKETTQATNQVVLLTRQRMSQILSVSEISKAIKIIHETQQYISNSKHELLLLRLKDLKSILIQTKYNEDLKVIAQETHFLELITDLSIDITNIHSLISGHKKGVNFIKINQNLEKIENILSECENKLKSVQNDTE